MVLRAGLLALTLLVAACGPAPPPRPPADNSLTVALESAPIHLDPRVATDQASSRVFELILDGLVTKDESGDFLPDLAESWEALDLGARWRFHLRPGIHFHDGSTFGAEDVVWTFETLLDGRVASSKRGAFAFLQRVVAIDPATVDFVLSEPFGALLPNLTSYLGIVPSGATPEAMNRLPVGTGPFRFVSRTADTIELAAFDGFYRGRPRLDRVVLREIPEATVRVLELRKGSVQLVVNALPPDVIPLFRADSRFSVPTASGANYVYLGLNLTDPLLGDLRVRRALALALDREQLVRTLWRGLGVVTETLLPPGNWARNDDLEPTPFDPAAARALLDAAGFPDPDGAGPEPRLRLTYKTSTDETAVLQAQILQSMWREYRRRRRDPLLRVRDFLRRYQARQLPTLQPDLDGDRRPRHLHADPALAARATGRLQPRTLLESALRRPRRAGSAPRRSRGAAAALPRGPGDRGARPALSLAVHEGQRRRPPRGPGRLPPLSERRAPQPAHDALGGARASRSPENRPRAERPGENRSAVSPSSPAFLRVYRGRDLPPTVRRLGAGSFFQDVASEMVYPLLPGFLAALGGGAAVLGAMESAAEGVLALVKGWAGRASDRLGRRKPFVVAGYGASALARPLLALAATASQVIALRLWDRLAKGLRTAPRDALIAEAVAPAGRAYAFSYHRGLDHLGAACGPLLAAILLLLFPDGIRTVFLVATLPALAGFLTVAFGLPREPPRRLPAGTAAGAAGTTSPPGAAAAREPLPRPLRAALAAFFCFALGNASDAFLLLRASEIGIGAVGLTLLWSAFHVAKWLASAPGGKLADRIGRRPAILLGWTLYAVAYAGFAVISQPVALLGLLALYAAFYGLTEGAERALVVELAGRSAGAAGAAGGLGGTGAGSALGAFHLAAGVGTFLASLWFGLVWHLFGAPPAFFAGAALAAGAAIVLHLGTGRPGRPEEAA